MPTFFSSKNRSDDRAVERGERVYLRPALLDDERAFLAFVRASQGLHDGLVSPPTDAASFAAYIERTDAPNFVALLNCRAADGAIVGVYNLSIMRGPFQNAFLGYYANAAYAGRGYMSEGLRLTIEHAFGALELHRLEANIQPRNEASIRLAEAVGFRHEGFSPRYLEIGGVWCDHERYALTVEDVA